MQIHASPGVLPDHATMTRLGRTSPFIPCASLARQRDFHCGTLGFLCRYSADNSAFLSRDDAAVRLLECPPRADGRPLGAGQSFHVDVEALDPLWQALAPVLAPALARLPPERGRAPFDQPYGQREFHVIDEDGALIFFGEPAVRAESNRAAGQGSGGRANTQA